MRFLWRWSRVAWASRSRPDKAQGGRRQVEAILAVRVLGRS
jgi:hypothetical protein